MSWLFLAALFAASPAAPSRPTWAIVTRAPALASERVSLEFGTLGVAQRSPYALAYYARRTVSGGGGRPPEVRWADSLACPALNRALADLHQLPVPRIDIPGFPAQPGGTSEAVVVDGITYTLTLSEGLRFSANVDSALSRWTEQTLERLKPCWRAQAPKDVS